MFLFRHYTTIKLHYPYQGFKGILLYHSTSNSKTSFPVYICFKNIQMAQGRLYFCLYKHTPYLSFLKFRKCERLRMLHVLYFEYKALHKYFRKIMAFEIHIYSLKFMSKYWNSSHCLNVFHIINCLVKKK